MAKIIVTHTDGRVKDDVWEDASLADFVKIQSQLYPYIGIATITYDFETK